MSRGTVRERQVRHQLEADNWVVLRAAGSLGICDLIALRAGDEPRLIEVKSDGAGPWAHFSPARRRALIFAAQRAGASAWLVWWPPRRQPQWIKAADWPLARAA